MKTTNVSSAAKDGQCVVALLVQPERPVRAASENIRRNVEQRQAISSLNENTRNLVASISFKTSLREVVALIRFHRL